MASSVFKKLGSLINRLQEKPNTFSAKPLIPVRYKQGRASEFFLFLKNHPHMIKFLIVVSAMAMGGVEKGKEVAHVLEMVSPSRRSDVLIPPHSRQREEDVPLIEAGREVEQQEDPAPSSESQRIS